MATVKKMMKAVQPETLVVQDLSRFIDLLGSAVGAIDKDSPLPILTGVLVEVEGGRVTLTGSDSTATVKVSDDGIMTYLGDLKFVVPGKFLFDAIKKLPKGEIEMEIVPDVNLTMKVKVGKKNPVSMQINLMEAEQYPVFDRKRLTNRISLPAKEFRSILQSSLYATEKKQDMHIMAGIHIEMSDGKLLATATDRHRLNTMQLPMDIDVESIRNIVIPVKAVKEMIKMLDSIGEDIGFEYSENEVQIVSEGHVYQTRLLDGKYPDTGKIIPLTHQSTCRVKREALLEGLDRASICASDKIITLQLGAEGLMLRAKSSGPKYEEEVELESSEGEVFLGIDVFFLMDALKSFSSGLVDLKFNGPLQPVRVDPIQNEGLSHVALIIPVRMNEE